MGSMVKCKNCETVLHSMYRHDFQACKCEEDKDRIFVDGGFDYGRFGGYPENMEHINHTHPNKENLHEVILTDTMYASLL